MPSRTLTRHETITAETTWYVSDPAALGWSRRSFTATGPVSDEQVDTDKQAKADERRQVIALNKLALAATEVRRQKVPEFLARNTLPKGKAAAVARISEGEDRFEQGQRVNPVRMQSCVCSGGRSAEGMSDEMDSSAGSEITSSIQTAWSSVLVQWHALRRVRRRRVRRKRVLGGMRRNPAGSSTTSELPTTAPAPA